MARKKSFNDIQNQTNRLLSANRSSVYGSPRRESQISDTFSKYFHNLQKTPSVKNSRKSYLKMRESGNQKGVEKLRSKMSNYKFPRSTYMGLNNG
jgi:hypothetical protein